MLAAHSTGANRQQKKSVFMTEPTAHQAATHSMPWAQTGRQPRIAIIGAGMSGIAAVVKLQKAGYTDVTVYEKTDRVGGTWRENTYPGLSCDVPSRWYSFYFALKADWPHRYSYGADIQAYLEQVAEDFGVTQKVTFNTAVAELTYEAPCWRLVTSRWQAGDIRCGHLCNGYFASAPISRHQGTRHFSGCLFSHRTLGSFHRIKRSTRWHHRHGFYSLPNRRCYHRSGERNARIPAHSPLAVAAAADRVFNRLESVNVCISFSAKTDLSLLLPAYGPHIQRGHCWQQVHATSH